MLHAIIIDDERKGRTVLQQLLQKHCPQVEVVALAESSSAGKKAIREHHPDIVFLDVEMPGESGFEMLESLDKIDFNVVFTTAHDHYAIKAIRVSALDYLLKPINARDLAGAVDKAEKAQTSVKPEEQMEVFFENLKSANSKIALPTRQGLVFVQMNDILRLGADSNYTNIFLTDGRHFIAAKTLKDFEEMLPESAFIRIHQSHLVNSFHIKQYIRGDGGEVVLSDGSKLEVSRRQKNELLQKMTR